MMLTDPIRGWKRSHAVLALAVAMLFAAGNASISWAQVLYGSITGVVEDASGAAVPRATVTATNTGTNQTAETTSDDAGRYTLPNLLPGTYDVKVVAQGFRGYTQTGLNITANTTTRAEVRLEVGGVSEQVTVEAGATQLQTDRASVQSEISAAAVTNLPLPAFRNYQSLLNLVPGTTPAVFQNAQIDSPGRALSTSVNGTARNNNNTRLDGATNVMVWLPHHTAYVAPAETIDTVNITTNAFDAEQGMAGGAAITVITKSGTNELHGVAFGYHDNQHLRSRSYFLNPTQDKPLSINNIVGGTLGGPIVKNKLFFFGSYEGTFNRTGFNSVYTVPTPDVRAGNFSQYANTTIFDPATTRTNAQGQIVRDPFPGNIIPANRISSIALRVLEGVPQPNQGGPSANFNASGTPALDRHNYDGKINWNRTPTHMIWGKYSRMDAAVNQRAVFGDVFGGPSLSSGGGTGTGDTKIQLVTVGNTWTLSPSLILDGNFGWTNMDQAVLQSDYGINYGSDVLGIPGTNGPDIRQSGYPSFNFNTYTAIGTVGTWQPAFRNDTSYTGTVNMTKLAGAHEFRWGYDVVRHALNHWQPELGGGPRGSFTFDPGITSTQATAVGTPVPAANQYNSFAAFLLGLPSQVSKSLQYEEMTTREWQNGFYFRDRWQVNRRLTLNLGVRYEFYPLIRRADRGVERYLLATNQMIIGGRGNQPEDAGISVSKTLFAPRVGFAFRATDNTVIRSGYGITYNPMPLSRPLRGFYPLTIAQDFVAANNFTPFGSLSTGIPAFSGPDLSGGIVTPPNTVQVRSPYDQLQRGYIQSWNFILEHRLPGQLVVSAGYVGTSTVKGFGDREINAAEAGQGNAGRPLARAFGRTASTWYFDGYLNANYHSLQTSFNKQMSNGLLLKGAYTWSKAINVTDDDGWTGSQTFNADSQWNRNRAAAGYDRTHSVSLGAIYELPFGRNKPFLQEGIGGKLLGGWQLSTATTFYTGTPFTVTANGAALNAPGNTQTADLINPNVSKPGAVGRGENYYDPTAFAPVTTARFGNLGRNVLRGPSLFNSDLTLLRKFAITERVNLEFKADSFNWTNTPKFSNPNADVSGGNFMQITTVRTDLPSAERQFRFGLRLAF